MAKRRGGRTVSEPISKHKRNAIIAAALGVVTVLAVAGGLAYDQSRNASASEASGYVSTYTPPLTPEVAEKTDLVTVGNALVGTDPYTVTVVGDSTGNAENEWVYLLGNQLVQRGRSVLIHNWNVDTNVYDSETLLGRPEAPRVEVWNGSASGKDSLYSLDNWSAMVPVSPDLLFISHGQNEATPETATANAFRMIKLAQPGDHKAATAVVLQNPRTDDEAPRLESIVKAQRREFLYSEAATIDVYAAFEQSGDVAALVNADDGLHPNDAGEQLWARTTTDALGITS